MPADPLDQIEPMSAEEGRAAARVLRLRRQLQDEFLSLACAVCHAVPVPVGEVCSCGGAERLDRAAFDALRHDDGPGYVALLAEMSRAVRVAMERLGVSEILTGG